MKLQQKHFICMQMMIKGVPIATIADELGYRPRTVYGWGMDEDFRAELDRQRKACADRAIELLWGNVDVAMLKVIELTQCGSKSVELKAAQEVLNRMMGTPQQTIRQTVDMKSDVHVNATALLEDEDSRELLRELHSRLNSNQEE